VFARDARGDVSGRDKRSLGRVDFGVLSEGFV